MSITGQQLISGKSSANSSETFHAINPATSIKLDEAFHEATADEVNAALDAADAAFDTLQTVPADTIAELLEAIADGLESAGESLLERAHAETALPMARLKGERGRTCNQTRIFAEMARQDQWRQPRIDVGDPTRKPPKPDVRTMLYGVGPVVVFGASNFPLAISVAGTDTVSALAARCPVVVKAHPAHPGTCEMIARVIAAAVEKVGLPPGTFSMVQGKTNETGCRLVEHEKVAAVAFTGSLKGGRALFDAVNRRKNPIPFYAEMGSLNPVFLLPSALEERGAEIATGYLQSVNLGVGQFCTNPGLVLGVEGASYDSFISAVKTAAADVAPATMLHPGIHAAFETGQQRLSKTDGVTCVASSNQSSTAGAHQATCYVYETDISKIGNEAISEEVFGPSSIIVRCQSTTQMLDYARSLDGHLTATIHGTEDDLKENAELVRLLQRKVGRIVFNGFPTGIEVCNAMHHGGPYPATTHSFFTSIGQHSIYRFVKPVCFQGFPDSCLPVQLRNAT